MQGKGYMEHDTFVVAEQYQFRLFPVYKEGDHNAALGGVTRQLQYSCELGEATWQLAVAKA